MAAEDFEKTVKKNLIDRDWTMTDLAAAISEKTGLYCDQAYISRIFAGKRKAPKIVQAIREILDIPMIAEAQTEKQDGRGGSHGST